MKSQENRRKALLYSHGAFTLLTRIILVSIFLWLIVDYIFDKPRSNDPEDIFNFVLRQHIATNTAFLVRFVIFGALSILSIISIVTILRTLKNEYKPRETVPITRATEFIYRTDFRTSPYVLILRPFGNDGNLYVQKKKGFFRTLINPIIATTTIEQIIAQEASENLGCDTVAVVEPDAKMLAPGPIYLSCPGDWKSDVEELVKYADYILFVFPPGSDLTPHVITEMEFCRKLSKINQVSIILPVSKGRSTLPIEKIIESASIFTDLKAEMQHLRIKSKSILALKLGAPTEYRYFHRWFGSLAAILPMDSEVYEEFLRTFFTSAEKRKQ